MIILTVRPKDGRNKEGKSNFSAVVKREIHGRKGMRMRGKGKELNHALLLLLNNHFIGSYRTI